MILSKGEIIYNCFYGTIEAERVEKALKYLQSREFVLITSEKEKDLIDQLNALKIYFRRKFSKCRGNYEYFEKTCENFMLADFPFDFEVDYFMPSLSPSLISTKVTEKSQKFKGGGRQKKPYNDKKRSAKLSEAIKVSKCADFNSDLLLRAALYAAQKENKKIRASRIKSILNTNKLKEVKKVSYNL